jgi:hypothetical protein
MAFACEGRAAGWLRAEGIATNRATASAFAANILPVIHAIAAVLNPLAGMRSAREGGNGNPQRPGTSSSEKAFPSSDENSGPVTCCWASPPADRARFHRLHRQRLPTRDGPSA